MPATAGRGGADRARRQSRPGRDRRQARAAGYDVHVAAPADCRPCRACSADYLNQITAAAPTASTAHRDATTIGVSGSIPIFQGGLTSARIRQAQALEGQPLEQVVGTERAVVAATRSAFANYDAAQKAIQSQTVAVQANELALEGARAEQSVGTRTVLDVLNAEQELLQSQVALVTAKRDAYVAGFQLLNAMGQAEAAGPRARRRAALRSARQLPPRRRQLERLGERPAPSDPAATRTVDPAGASAGADRHAALGPRPVLTEPAVTSRA